MIGLLMLQLARLAGAAKVALLEPIESKREVGKELGADICIDPIHENVKAKLKEHGMTWVNTVIECVGRPATIAQAIEIAGPKAVVMMFGLTKPEEEIAIKPFEIFQKELELKASYINPLTQKRALDLIDSGRLDVSSTAKSTNKYRYQANRAFIIGRIKTIVPKILCNLFDLSAIDRLYKESLRCRSQIMPGRTFRRKKNKAIGRTHFNNKKVAF